MTRMIVTFPDNADAADAIKKMAKAVGGKAVIEKPIQKQPRTQLQQDFVDAYKEALAAERGEVELKPLGSLIQKLKAKRENASH